MMTTKRAALEAMLGEEERTARYQGAMLGIRALARELVLGRGGPESQRPVSAPAQYSKTRLITLELHNKRYSVTKIAAKRGLCERTIQQHLVELYRDRKSRMCAVSG